MTDQLPLTKECLAAIFEELCNMPMSTLGPSPHTFEPDARGVTAIKNRDGIIRALMPTDVYEEILQHKIGKAPII